MQAEWMLAICYGRQVGGSRQAPVVPTRAEAISNSWRLCRLSFEVVSNNFLCARVMPTYPHADDDHMAELQALAAVHGDQRHLIGGGIVGHFADLVFHQQMRNVFLCKPLRHFLTMSGKYIDAIGSEMWTLVSGRPFKDGCLTTRQIA